MKLEVFLLCVTGHLSLRFQDAPSSSMKNSDTSELTREYCMGLPWCPGECSNFCAPVPAVVAPIAPVAAAVATAQKAAHRSIHHSKHHHRHRRRKSNDDHENTALVLSFSSTTLTVAELIASADFRKIVMRGLATALKARLPSASLANVAAAEGHILNLRLTEDGPRTSALLQSSRTNHDGDYRVRAAFEWNFFTAALTHEVFRAQVKTTAFKTSVKTTAVSLITNGATGITQIAGVTLKGVTEESSQVTEIEAKTTFEWTVEDGGVDAEFIAASETVLTAVKAAYSEVLGVAEGTVAVVQAEVATNKKTESIMFLDFTVPDADAGTQLAHNSAETVFRGKVTAAIALGLGVDGSRIKVSALAKQTTTETVVAELSFGVTLAEGATLDALKSSTEFEDGMKTVVATALGVDAARVDITAMAIRVVNGRVTFNMGGLTEAQAELLRTNPTFVAAVQDAIHAQLSADGVAAEDISAPVITLGGETKTLNLKEAGGSELKRTNRQMIALYSVRVPQIPGDGGSEQGPDARAVVTAAVLVTQASTGAATGFFDTLTSTLAEATSDSLIQAGTLQSDDVAMATLGEVEDRVQVTYEIDEQSSAGADSLIEQIEDTVALAASFTTKIASAGTANGLGTVRQHDAVEVDSNDVTQEQVGVKASSAVTRVKASSKYTRKFKGNASSMRKSREGSAVSASYQLTYELHTPSVLETTMVRDILRNEVNARAFSVSVKTHLASQSLSLSTGDAVTCLRALVKRSSTSAPVDADVTHPTTQATVTITAADTAESRRIQAKLNSNSLVTLMKDAINADASLTALESPNTIVSLRVVSNPTDTAVHLE